MFRDPTLLQSHGALHLDILDILVVTLAVSDGLLGENVSAINHVTASSFILTLGGGTQTGDILLCWTSLGRFRAASGTT